jgi:geranylgeranyl diphosphate synthase type II
MLLNYKNQIDCIIIDYFSRIKSNCESGLAKKMLEYVLVNDGKKLRPIIALICFEILELKIEQVANYLIAIELMHTYTLVHDDLPSIDNDNARRGKPTAHKVFGEANAILLGDLLHTLTFELLSESNQFFSSNSILTSINEFAKTLGGLRGVIFGQLLDINNTDITSVAAIEKIHTKKTAIFFGFCTSFAMILTNQNLEKIQEFKNFGIQYGLLFQLLDDIEDFTESKIETNICNIIGISDAKLLYLQKKKNLKSEFDILNQFVKLTLKNIQ